MNKNECVASSPSTVYDEESGRKLVPCMDPYTMETIWTDCGESVTPQMVVHNHFTDTQVRPASDRLVKYRDRYEVRRHSGRVTHVGRLLLNHKLIVNPKPDTSFDALFCMADYDGISEPKSIVIPYSDFQKRRFYPYMPGFQLSPGCPPKYADLAFEDAFISGEQPKFFATPLHSGWTNECDGKVLFASSANIIPELGKYYPPDISQRHLLYTQKTIHEAAEGLSKQLPNKWQYKLGLAIRLTGILLYWYSKAPLMPDQMLVVEPSCEANARGIIALLKTQDCRDLSTCSLNVSMTALRQNLDLVNDGNALFRDSSLLEDRKRRDAALNYLVQELHGANGSSSLRRKQMVIVTEHAGTMPELPGLHLSFHGCPDIDDIPAFQNAIGEWDSAFIDHLSHSDPKENEITRALRQTKYLTKNIANADDYMTTRMIRTSVEILVNYKLITPQEQGEIIRFLKTSHYAPSNPDLLICNEFKKVLSDLILEGKIRLSNQFAPPYYDSERSMAVLDAKYINIPAGVVNASILPRMTITHRRNKVLQAMDAGGLLHHTNNYLRNIEVMTVSDIQQTYSFYSFPKSILSSKCQDKLNTLTCADHVFQRWQFPDNFVPILSVGASGTAGRVIDENTDAAESLYASGQTRSGKTYFLTQQVLIRAEHGQKVIVFDQTGAFSHDELCKHLSAEQVDEHFAFWNINEQGLPVDLLSMEHCTTLPDKKNRLFSILSVAAKITGEVQGKVLRRRLSGIAKAIDTGDIRSLPQTLDYFDESDAEQAAIRARLEDVFEDLEGLETHCQNWGAFLTTQHEVIVISTDLDGIRKSSQLIDMLLANLYTYKQHDRDPRYTVVLDELEDLCLEKGGPISTILRKGGKHRLSLLMASQEFSAEKDRLGKLVGNSNLFLFFRPKDADLSEISKHIGVERNTLARLEQGECVAVGEFYSRSKGQNCRATLTGKAFDVAAMLHSSV